eukprot:TRINITY_DN9707_c1_g1_i1.p1 TRINITY_DN9707_c1_g1~~TRINITY_DN9707_c1_g1_i1.p1  ORF type:complete len:784 (-),score=40.85 TRINITY_DN9707_c1_g1_i1:1146-3497(-)
MQTTKSRFPRQTAMKPATRRLRTFHAGVRARCLQNVVKVCCVGHSHYCVVGRSRQRLRNIRLLPNAQLPHTHSFGEEYDQNATSSAFRDQTIVNSSHTPDNLWGVGVGVEKSALSSSSELGVGIGASLLVDPPVIASSQQQQPSSQTLNSLDRLLGTELNSNSSPDLINELENQHLSSEQQYQVPDYLEQLDSDPSQAQSCHSLKSKSQQPEEVQSLLTDIIEEKVIDDLLSQSTLQPASISTSINDQISTSSNGATTTPPLSQDSIISTEDQGTHSLISDFVEQDGKKAVGGSDSGPTFIAPDYVEQLDLDSPIQKVQQKSEANQDAKLANVLKLAIPALGFVLADPLMSLVDTACVGQTSSLQLAALGPNTAIFNLVFQVFQFLGLVASNILAMNSVDAPGISADEKMSRKSKAEKMMSHAIVAAGVMGISMTCLLQAVGPQLLAAVGTSPELMGPALSYLRIRALATPGVLISNVATGTCIGQQDSVTPMLVYAVSGLINLALDMYLILGVGIGVTGAALATTAAQYIGTAFFLWYLRHKGKTGSGIPLVWHGFPKLADLKPFAAVAGTLLLRTMFTMLAFTAISVSATMLGTIPTAAHQVALQVFWFLSFVPEPLSLTAQSLIARDSTDATKVKQMARTILKMGCAVGVTLGGLMASIFIGLPWLFTSDILVKSAIAPLTPAAVAAILSCSLVMMLDGISIGSNDFAHLPFTNLSGLVITLAMLAHSMTTGLGLQSVWWCLATFFQTRLVLHLWHHLTNWKQSAFGRYDRSTSALVVVA